MKRLLLVLALIVAAGAVSYAVSYRRAMDPVITPDGTDRELAFLQREFALTPEQYEKVVALHHAYRPICAEHCMDYAAVHRRLATMLEQQKGWSPEVSVAIAEQARIQGECHASMLRYAYDVAACMSPDQGKRYLEMIKMQLVQGDPAGMFAKAR